MVAPGTVRTATERRLIEVIGELDGFTTTPAKGQWYVTPAATAIGNRVPNRRCVLIGTPDGPLDPDGIAAGRAPSIDNWSIACMAACTDIADELDAKQACETAVNAIADELARSTRLGMADGPRDLSVALAAGPFFGWDSERTPTGWWEFEVRCFADIERHRP